jgi:hypothetical protein
MLYMGIKLFAQPTTAIDFGNTVPAISNLDAQVSSKHQASNHHNVGANIGGNSCKTGSLIGSMHYVANV